MLSSFTTKTGLATGCSIPVRGDALTGTGTGVGLAVIEADGEALGEGETATDWLPKVSSESMGPAQLVSNIRHRPPIVSCPIVRDGFLRGGRTVGMGITLSLWGADQC